MAQARLVPFLPFFLLTLILSLITVQASDDIASPPLIILSSPTPSSPRVLAHPLNSSETEVKQTSSPPASTLASSSASTANNHLAAKLSATVANTDTTYRSGNTGSPAKPPNCNDPDITKRSWLFEGRMAAYLNTRGFCETPGTLEPDTGLVPNPDAPSESKSKPQSASSPEPQAAKETQQIDSQPAKDALQMDSQPAMPAAASAPTDSPVIVQGQTAPADGHQITVNNQIVRISSGSIYVGSSAAPIAQVQAAQSHDQFLVAGTLTFHPALPSQSPQAAPVPAVVGGLTFSAPQSEPSVEADTAKSQTQAQPVVIGGKTYAPVNPQAGVSQEQANTPKQGDSELSSSHEQSSNAIDDESAQTGSKPIVIGGLEYTLVTASPTSSPQSESIFYYDGVALTQGGKAVMVSSTLISLGPSGVVVGTSTLSLSTPTPAVSLLAIGSETLTALGGSEGGFKIDDFTLLPGSSAAIINGTTLSINAADSLIVGTSTIPLATAGSGNKGNGVLTADGKTFTPLGSTAIVVDGTTISIGGSAITENGTRLSLASNGLLIGSSTFAYATPVANTATVSTASGTFRTSVLPSGGATPTAVPSATGSVGRSAASVKTITPGVIAIWFGISMALLMMIELS